MVQWVKAPAEGLRVFSPHDPHNGRKNQLVQVLLRPLHMHHWTHMCGRYVHAKLNAIT